MTLMSVFDTAASGMTAQAIRLNTVTSNLANADSVTPAGKLPYRAKEPIFEPARQDLTGFDDVFAEANQAVQVPKIVESNKSFRQEYQPYNPNADANGMVTFSNVNMVEEMANMISASRAYSTNVQMMNTGKELVLRTLQLGS